MRSSLKEAEARSKIGHAYYVGNSNDVKDMKIKGGRQRLLLFVFLCWLPFIFIFLIDPPPLNLFIPVALVNIVGWLFFIFFIIEKEPLKEDEGTHNLTRYIENVKNHSKFYYLFLVIYLLNIMLYLYLEKSLVLGIIIPIPFVFFIMFFNGYFADGFQSMNKILAHDYKFRYYPWRYGNSPKMVMIFSILLMIIFPFCFIATFNYFYINMKILFILSFSLTLIFLMLGFAFLVLTFGLFLKCKTIMRKKKL